MAFLVVIPIAMLWAIIFDKKIEETLALSMIWATLLTYLCGIVYELWIASYLIAGISVISLGAAVYLSLKRTKDYFYKVLIISGLVYLVHIKTTGIILALICVMIIAGMELVYGEIEGIRRYRFSIVCAVVSVVSKLSWSLFCRFNDGEES
jgi:hypothetical protein